MPPGTLEKMSKKQMIDTMVQFELDMEKDKFKPEIIDELREKRAMVLSQLAEELNSEDIEALDEYVTEKAKNGGDPLPEYYDDPNIKRVYLASVLVRNHVDGKKEKAA